MPIARAEGNYTSQTAPKGEDSTESPKRSKWQRLRRYIEIASNAGEVFMSLRDKPRILDYLALGLRVMNLADRVREEVQSSRPRPRPTDAFDDWIRFPDSLSPIVIGMATNRRVITEHWTGEKDTTRPIVAQLGAVKVGWLAREDWESSMPVGYDLSACWHEKGVDIKTVWRSLGARLWEVAGTRHLVYAGCHELPTPFVDQNNEPYRESTQMRSVRHRLQLFLDAGINRGVLFTGSPGTGKSRAARALVDQLGLRSLYVRSSWFEGASPPGPALYLDDVIQVYRPDVLIIDDVDRVDRGHHGQVLRSIEEAVQSCKLVICTINCPDLIPGALMRPKRIDDVVVFAPPDRETVEELLGPDLVDLAPKLDGLPVVYVIEFAQRCRALGRLAADAEIETLRKQAAEVEKRTRREDNWEEAA